MLLRKIRVRGGLLLMRMTARQVVVDWNDDHLWYIDPMRLSRLFRVFKYILRRRMKQAVSLAGSGCSFRILKRIFLL